MKKQTDPTSIQILFEKYTKGEASAAETADLFKHIGENQNDAEMNNLLAAELDATDAEPEYDPSWELPLKNIKNQYFQKQALSTQKSSIKLWPRLAALAAAVAIFIIGGYFLTAKHEIVNDYRHLTAHDIQPGKVGATLTLANGSKINLNHASSGEIFKESGISILKTADGQVVYQIQSKKGAENQFNTLTTAIGQTYMVTLPDQTKVWLNAASSLTYHASATVNGQRRVKLTGEAYFEVAKDKAHPFIVESGTQQIEVLGTHFNVNAYEDEQVFKTTLLEGSIKIANQDQVKILLPGMQASSSSKGIQLSSVDTEFAVAWKNNNFTFERLDIKEIMRMIARWYDVDVVYKGEIPEGTFWGSVSRFDKISKALIPLEATGNVHFNIEGRTIYVYR